MSKIRLREGPDPIIKEPEVVKPKQTIDYIPLSGSYATSDWVIISGSYVTGIQTTSVSGSYATSDWVTTTNSSGWITWPMQ
jgi:hypothetical protein